VCWKQFLTDILSEQDIKYKCFICGINRDVFDARMIDSTAGKTGAQGHERRNQNGITTNERKGAGRLRSKLGNSLWTLILLHQNENTDIVTSKRE
jgi:hypothetical protein